MTGYTSTSNIIPTLNINLSQFKAIQGSPRQKSEASEAFGASEAFKAFEAFGASEASEAIGA